MTLILSSFKFQFQKSYHVHKYLFNSEPFVRYTGFRNLVSPAILGMDRFLQKRTQVQGEYAKIKDTFIDLMKGMYQNNSEIININGQDVKNMIYICENDKMQLNLLQDMMKKFLPTGGIFGPEIVGLEYLKLLYHLKLPNEMRKVLNEKELSKIFEKMLSYLIAMTLFYNNKLYNDIIDTYHLMMSKNVIARKSVKLLTMITMAACYHLDSPWSLREATSIIKQQEEIHMLVHPRALSFASALALKQNQSYLAVELTSKTPWNCYLLKNLKILALVEEGRVEDALPILRGYSEGFSTHPLNNKNDNVVFSSTLSSVKKALSLNKKNEALSEFNIIKKELAEKSLITDKNLTKELIEPLEDKLP